MTTAAGHRVRAHTADVIVEAWGPSRAACLDQVVRALVETFAEVARDAPVERVPVRLGPDDDDEEVLVALLDEFVYLLDVGDRLPVAVELEEDAMGALTGFFDTVSLDAVEVVGAVPKGVSRSGLVFGPAGRKWRCQVLVDV